MATILDFRSAQRAHDGRTRRLKQPCEIVLFPGVRYEYHAAAAAAAAAMDKPKRRTAKKHDKLELQD